jgi:amidophosphoribosyltransferase
MNEEWEDSPREECGVLGLYRPDPGNDPAWLVYLGLFALQHRGQEAAGICVSDGEQVLVEKDLGLVSEVFDEARLARLRLPGTEVAIGHVRYSTTGSNLRFNAQPLTVRSNKGILGLAHNGNFVNAKEMRRDMLDEGVVFQTTNDTEVMINRIARYSQLNLQEATAQTMHDLQGGFSVVLMDRHTLLGLRDGNGVRPLCVGTFAGGGFALASEPVGLAAIGARYLRDVRPGELIWFDRAGLHSRQVLEARSTPCAFEWIYFARGDSHLEGIDVHAARVRLGEQLAREAPAEAEIVVPVPDSGMGAAIGYSRQSGLPFDYGLLKNPYAGRSFIAPSQEARELKVRLKLSPTSAVRGKRVVLVDDSIVRGTTSRQIVALLREAGAAEVHFRVSSPPIRYPCYYGIDTAARKELVASTHTEEEIRRLIGADSLAFLSERGLQRAIGPAGLCLACFSGSYPAGTPEEQDSDKLVLEA